MEVKKKLNCRGKTCFKNVYAFHMNKRSIFNKKKKNKPLRVQSFLAKQTKLQTLRYEVTFVGNKRRRTKQYNTSQSVVVYLVLNLNFKVS